MITRLAWPRYRLDQTQSPTDAFWVECTLAEAKELLPEGGTFPEPGGLSREERRFGFLVARDLSFCLAHPWNYPYSNLWNAYNPFVSLPSSRAIRSLAELSSIEIMSSNDPSPVSPSAGQATKGSQRWIQQLIEEQPEVLFAAIADSIAIDPTETLTWHSPRRDDMYREYRDEAALRLAGIESLPVRPLREFWPQRGPVWDGIATTSGGASIFVEAKAHAAEVASPGTKAGEPAASQIRRSLEEARQFFAKSSEADWSGTFYQYANRLAHHYLVHEVNGIESHLVFLYFVNARDVRGPSSPAEWRSAIEVVHSALGLPAEITDPHVHEVFVDVSDLRGA